MPVQTGSPADRWQPRAIKGSRLAEWLAAPKSQGKSGQIARGSSKRKWRTSARARYRSQSSTGRDTPIVGLASHLGRGVQRIATDAVVGRVRSLPRTIGDLDAKALSQIMGRTVMSVVVIGGDAGTSSRARLALTGDGV